MADTKERKYEDLTSKERYESALRAEKEPWNPLKVAKEIIVEKFSKPKEAAPAPAPEKKMKKGGSVKSKCKCMVRGGGIEVRGKTKGRFV